MKYAPFVHIGFQKTASSWLIKNLLSKRDSGFYYPWMRGSAKEQKLSSVLLGQNSYSFDPARVHEVVRDDFVYAEKHNLRPAMQLNPISGVPWRKIYWGKEVGEWVKAAFPDARIVIGIREQRSMMWAQYREAIRLGQTYGLKVFAGDKGVPAYAPVCRPDHFEYDRIVGHYQNLFGKENVLVLPIELMRRSMEQYIQLVEEFAGVTISCEPTNKKVHSSLSPALLGLHRTINHLTHQYYIEHRSPFFSLNLDRAMKVLSAITPKVFSDYGEKKAMAYLDNALSGRYGKSNQRLEELTGLNLKELGYEMEPCQARVSETALASN